MSLSVAPDDRAGRGQPSRSGQPCAVPETQPVDAFARHAAICEVLDAHGHLVFASDDESKRLVRAIRQLAERFPTQARCGSSSCSG